MFLSTFCFLEPRKARPKNNGGLLLGWFRACWLLPPLEDGKRSDREGKGRTSQAYEISSALIKLNPARGVQDTKEETSVLKAPVGFEVPEEESSVYHCGTRCLLLQTR
jgi:hypothetical protein